MISEEALLAIGIVLVGGMGVIKLYDSLDTFGAILLIILICGVLSIAIAYFIEYKAKTGKDRRKRIETIKGTPTTLLTDSKAAVAMGFDEDLKTTVYLPDQLRRRHVHILGATGSGKTESVILNFLRQDVSRGIGAIILDAKGDDSFLTTLREWVPPVKLQVFDLGSENSLPYNPTEAGSSLESAQRLFSSLTWSEEYYKSKAFSALQRLFQNHFRKNDRNPTLVELGDYLEDQDKYTEATLCDGYPKKLAEKDFAELSGLRDQIKTLCTGHLSKILSGNSESEIRLIDAKSGYVLYFRLQSLMSPQLVTTVGKLLINHINFLAGSAHRFEGASNEANLVPIYLDEFASFACPEFADLISKARSAGFALHFSHQSVGDLTDISDGFLSRITDNSGTKIVLRINDPDSAEYFARTFGTKLYQKITQRITNVKQIEKAEVVGEGTQREAHQFRASPDLFKTLPTGVGSVLIAHGDDTPSGASHVFKIRFPRLERFAHRKMPNNNQALPGSKAEL
jgi:hypothetical protein